MQEIQRTLLVGFDSAWSNENSGSLTAALMADDNDITKEDSQPASLDEAILLIQKWQSDWNPERTIIAIDQPIVVSNTSGQRPVENIVSSIVGKHRGGVQPSSTSKSYFSQDAPIWKFVDAFGGASDPTVLSKPTSLIETYPTLHQIAMGYTLPTETEKRRLPKYNPKSTNFSRSDWKHVCSKLREDLEEIGFVTSSKKIKALGENTAPSKSDQDLVDSCFCLLTAHSVATGKAMSVGTVKSGYMVVPHNKEVLDKLKQRCIAKERDPSKFLNTLSSV